MTTLIPVVLVALSLPVLHSVYRAVQTETLTAYTLAIVHIGVWFLTCTVVVKLTDAYLIAYSLP